MASVQVSVQIVRRLCRLCADNVEAEAVQGAGCAGKCIWQPRPAAARCTAEEQTGAELRGVRLPGLVLCSAPSLSQSVFTIMEKAPTRAFSALKAPFTFKRLLSTMTLC